MKAQMEHSFTFIMLIILAGVVLLFGYRMIGGDSGILQKSCDVEQIELKQTVDKYIQTYSKYGTVQHKDIRAPCDTQQICFVDASLFGEANEAGIYAGTPTFTGSNPTMVSEIQFPSTPPNNVFLVDSDKTIPLQLWSAKIKVDKMLCINSTSGTFRVTFKGQGLRTLIEPT